MRGGLQSDAFRSIARHLERSSLAAAVLVRSEGPVSVIVAGHDDGRCDILSYAYGSFTAAGSGIGCLRRARRLVPFCCACIGYYDIYR